MTRTGTCSISFPCSSIGEKDGRAQLYPTLRGQFCTETPVQPVQVVRREPRFDQSFLLSPAPPPRCLPSTSKAATSQPASSHCQRSLLLSLRSAQLLLLPQHVSH